VTRVKICGITRLEDAELAASLGAWALGFILWPGSARAVDPAVAAGVAAQHRRRAELVGVFVDPTLEEVAHAAETIGLTHLQLHGSVGPSFCAEAARRTGCRVIRAFRIGSNADVQDTERFREVDLHLYDTHVEGLEGGTGRAWDWGLAARRRSKVPLVLSGGLTAENVAEGIAAVDPYAVDVASGVESAPGVKDPVRLRAFLEAAGALGEPAASTHEERR
jgi:phosphoribosylanthranilate isomerase